MGWGLGGREAQEGEDICIHTANSHCCIADTSTTFGAIGFKLKKSIDGRRKIITFLKLFYLCLYVVNLFILNFQSLEITCSFLPLPLESHLLDIFVAKSGV